MTSNPGDIEHALFGHPIKPTFRLTLAEQVYDALCREVHAGRWQIGDRLPGTSALANMSGLSHNVIQRALEALRDDGYVRMENRRGTFLKATLPKGTPPRGVIGIAMTPGEEVGSSQYDYIYLSRIHAIIKEATERAYTTEVVSLEEDGEWAGIDSRDGPFGDRVAGIFCLHAFPRMLPPTLESGRIPMVFLEPPPGICRPSVYHDGFLAVYQAARAALQAGHSRVLLYCGRPHPHYGINVSIEGYKRAMQEAGVQYSEEAIQTSLQHKEGDLAGIRAFIEKYNDATAIVSVTSATGRRLVSVCDVLGIDVPGDISIVSQASAPMRGTDSSLILSGSKALPTNTIREGFSILDELIAGQDTGRGEVLLRPGFVQGHSLAPPNTNPSPTTATKRASQSN